MTRSPRPSALEAYLEDLHASCRSLTEGTVADYIPELGKADPEWFGLAIATTDGEVYAVGDGDQAFTIQSVSKPFLYGCVLDALGRERVLRHVGVEPTGQAFNATLLDEENNRPFNPMVNAGAIAVSALVEGPTYAVRRRVMVDVLSRYAGRSLEIDETVFHSERDTGQRNRAIAALMRQAQMLDGDAEEILDLYFSQCSVLVTCKDLALMAATLANGGVNPRSGERAISAESAPDVLSVMNSCGMYNYAGQWSFEVGIPAKSGVSGAIAAIVPGQLGVAAFSPRLDRVGNSVRAIAAIKRLADDFGLHVFKTRPRSEDVVRSILRGDAVRSKRQWSLSERAALDAIGGAIRIIEAQGALFFAAAERLVRAAANERREAEHVILDFRRVIDADPAAVTLLARFANEAVETGGGLRFAHLEPSGALAGLRAAVGAEAVFADRDAALEACEEALLARHAARFAGTPARLGEVALFKNLPAHTLSALDARARRVRFEPGALIVREGDPADSVFAILEGAASVRLTAEGAGGARSVRIAALGPGATIGELALIDGVVRAADVMADAPTVCLSLSMADLRAAMASDPSLARTLTMNLARDLAGRLRAANREIRALES